MKYTLIETIRIAIFFTLSIIITVIDLRSRRIPDILSLGGIGVLIILGILNGLETLLPGLVSGFLAATIFWSVKLSTNGLGFGDVKLAFFIGMFLGPIGSLLAFPISALAGLTYAGYAIGIRREKTSIRIPYAPFLVFGAYAAFFIELFKLDRFIF